MGPDDIPIQGFLNIPSDIIVWFLAWLNEFWISGDISSSWKEAWVVTVRKPGKHAAQQASYRFVFLWTCVPKLFE